MQDRDHQIERAANTRDLHQLGDPERWGGDGDIELAVPTGNASDTTRFSKQIVRAQCADLIARAWNISAEYEVAGGAAGDAIALSLHVVWGSGQVSAEGYAQLPLLAVVPAGAFPWLSSPAGGALVLPQPLPATAIAIRARLRVVAPGTDPAHAVIARVKVCIAPRALQ